MSDHALTVITPAEAKQRALKVIEQNQGCVSYVRPEDLDTAALFLPVVSVIKPTKEDFYDPIPGVGIMAKPQLVNLLREKAGVNIIRTETEKRGEWVYHAHVYGEKRQPDGSMLTGDAAYEFDCEKRAELDAINQPNKYGTPVAARKHLLELAKFGEQRAVTGAQHALIHKLAHVARSFKSPDELMRGMIVLRIDRNVDGLLRDPQMRQAAMNLMLGKRDEIYGPGESTVTPAAIAAPAEPAPADDDGFADAPDEQPPFAAPAAAAPDPRDQVRAQLNAILADTAKRDTLSKKLDKASGKSAVDLIAEAVSDEAATADALQALLTRCGRLFGGGQA